MVGASASDSLPLEIKAVERFAVIILAGDFARADEGVGLAAVIEAHQVIAQVLIRAGGRMHHRPGTDQVAQDHRPAGFQHVALESGRAGHLRRIEGINRLHAERRQPGRAGCASPLRKLRFLRHASSDTCANEAS
jgi:hypothetical protein